MGETDEHHDLIAISKPWATAPDDCGRAENWHGLAGGLACDDLLTVRTFSFLPAYLAHQFDLVRVLPDLRSPFTGLYFAYPAQIFVPVRVSEARGEMTSALLEPVHTGQAVARQPPAKGR